MSSIEEKYPFGTLEESIINKDWACGSRNQSSRKELVIGQSGSGCYAKVSYPPAWWKIIDEVVVNALDQMVRCVGTSKPVTYIKVQFARDGRVTVSNDGAGIEVAIHKIASEKLGKQIWLPTFIFGYTFQGSNHTRTKDSIIGGTNGLGAKLANCYSTEFSVETICNGMYFKQHWYSHKTVESEPIVMPLAQARGQFACGGKECTTISFIPDYTGLFGYSTFDETTYSQLVDIVYTRAVFASIYAHYTCMQKRVGIFFNGVEIPYRGVCDLANLLFPNSHRVSTVLTPTVSSNMPEYKHPWQVCAVITDVMPANQLSVVNGIVVSQGKHMERLFSQISTGINANIAKILEDKNLKIPTNSFLQNIFLMVNAKIPNPNWTGQRKDVLDINTKYLAGYVLDRKFLAGICMHMKEQITLNIIASENKPKKTKLDFEKCSDAEYAGGSRSHECVLIPVEGDSAMTQVRTAISNNPHMGFKKYGIISLGGVIMNARKECTVIESNGTKLVRKTNKLAKNVLMEALMGMLGLNMTFKYDRDSATYLREMKSLRYGSMAICVDQDLDGKGNILGLLLNLFELFWPNLIKNGYVRWYCTPIIRAYPKRGGKVFEFYSENDYRAWADGVNTSAYSINYYKGLGSHSKDETIQMFREFHRHLYQYYLDKRSGGLFEVYFGKDPDLRKQELRLPTKTICAGEFEEQEATHKISCSQYLEYEANLYQKDNLERKLDHAIDGQNQAGRKILDGIIEMFRHSNKPMKVCEMSGYITSHKNYHHGEDSLNKSIVSRGLITVGGKQLPLIIPLSNFGSRFGGGKDAAKPRYIYAKLNDRITPLVFPMEDYWNLPFNFAEGKRGEPKYFVPIIPVSIIESTEIPSHGWKLKTWGREVLDVIGVVKTMISCKDGVDHFTLPPCTYGWRGSMKLVRGNLYSFGKYTCYSDSKNSHVLHITELPLRVWTRPYIAALNKKADENIIKGISDESDDASVSIKIKLAPGAIERLEPLGDAHFTDGIEEYFLLRQRMDSNINLIGMNGEVIMFNSYEEVLKYWFPIRKQYYIKRVERQEILLRLRIKHMENVIRYIEMTQEMGLVRQKYEFMCSKLTGENFDKIYSARLNNPKFIQAADMENTILRGSKATYDYLLDLSDRKKSHESMVQFAADLTKLKSELTQLQEMASYGHFPGASIWRHELDVLADNIKLGRKTAWKYGDHNKYKFD